MIFVFLWRKQKKYSNIMKKLFPVLILLMLSISAYSQDASAVTGNWYTENEESIIRIYESGGKYYGEIHWVEEPKDKNGNYKKDKNNPDKSKRDRRLLGLVILKDFKYDGDGEWSEGKIYDPEKGKTYQAQMQLKGNGKLEVRGYIGVPAFGRSTVWTREN